MADTSSERLQGGVDKHGEVQERQASADIEYDRRESQYDTGHGISSLPLYPPGPGDREAWARLIARFPEVEPTFCKDGHMLPEMQETESELRRTPDGNPSRVDLRLRAIGNGVVPAVAARAFIVLAEKLKKEVDIPDIIKEKLHE